MIQFFYHKAETVTFLMGQDEHFGKILLLVTCRLLSLPQVQISLKMAAFSNSGRN
jgi:hypothetical protein